jgi:hypothetical protein
LLARLRVGDAGVERGLRQTDGQGTDGDPPSIEDLEERPESLALGTEQVLGGDPCVLEPQFAGRRCMEPELVLESTDAEPRRFGGER